MFYIRILIIAEMEPRYELLDAKHRGRLIFTKGVKEVLTLRLRTPKTSWQIHEQWIERYVVHICCDIFEYFIGYCSLNKLICVRSSHSVCVVVVVAGR